MIIRVCTRTMPEHKVIIDLLFLHLGGIRGWQHKELLETVDRNFPSGPLVFVIDNERPNEVRGSADGECIGLQEFLEQHLGYNNY